MATIYQVFVYSPSGTRTHILSDIRGIEITHKINDVDEIILRVPALTSTPVVDSIVEIYRRLDGLEWYKEAVGFLRTFQDEFTEGGRRLVTLYCRGLLDLIHRRSILYPSVSAYTLKSGPGETVILEYVNENAGPGASAATRKRDGVTYNLTLAPDNARGTTWTGEKVWINLLDAIRDVALGSGLIFRVVQTGSAVNQFLFEVYESEELDLVFSTTYGNIAMPVYSIQRADESTVVTVLGDGEGTARRTLTVEHSSSLDSPWNDIESLTDVHAKEATLSEMQTKADGYLKGSIAEEDFSCKVVQVPTFRYGEEYHFTDTLLVQFLGRSFQRRINRVYLNIDAENAERIDIELTQVGEAGS